MDVRLSQEKTRRNPPLAQTVWEEETLALSLLSASSRVVHGATFVHQSYVRSELMIFFYEDKKHNFYEKKKHNSTKHYLQCKTHYATLLTEQYLRYLQCRLLMVTSKKNIITCNTSYLHYK